MTQFTDGFGRELDRDERVPLRPDKVVRVSLRDEEETDNQSEEENTSSRSGRSNSGERKFTW